jgi:pyruvate,water dikinase
MSISVSGRDIDARNELIMWLDDSSATLAQVGSKFHNLVILHRRGFRIPPAFCVSTNAFRYFLNFNDLTHRINQTLNGINFDNGEEISTRARRIRALIGSGQMPPTLAEAITKGLTALSPTSVSVRSSSTSEDLAEASFAGVYDSFLNVIGIKQVLQNIKACWASLFSERSLYYYFEQVKKGRLSAIDIAIAVIVQDMIHSQKSGICFTANPESLRNDEIVIEAAYGLGEGVVSGEIASDIYVVRKGTWQVISRKLSEKLAAVVPDKAGGVREIRMGEEANDLPVLSDEEVRELAEVSSKIESVFGSLQDIEWSKDRVRGFFILQSRPITTFYQ